MLAVFLVLGFLFPRLSTGRVAGLALCVSILVELSQLYHARWIDSIRHTAVGHLALGSDFDLKDLVRYASGIGVGVLIEAMVTNGIPKNDLPCPRAVSVVYDKPGDRSS